MASEATSLGAHTDLWRPKDGDLSSMVDKLGWRRLFPPMRKAWDTLGTLKPEVAAATGLPPDVRIICGAHDSNASLVPHLISRRDPFTVISTGTWVIIMAVGGTARLDPEADMLANVDVRGEPVPTARFMGGREFAVLAGDAPADADEADVAAVIASGALALPAFSDQGGPFAARKGVIEGPAPDNAKSARGARDALFRADDRAHASAASKRRATSSSKAASPALLLSPPCSLASWPAGGWWSRRRAQALRRARRCWRIGASPIRRRSLSRRAFGICPGSRPTAIGGSGRFRRSGCRGASLGAIACNLPAAISFHIVNKCGRLRAGAYVSDIHASIGRDFDAHSGSAGASAVGPFSRPGHCRARDHLDSRRARSHARGFGRARFEGQPGASFLRFRGRIGRQRLPSRRGRRRAVFRLADRPARAQKALLHHHRRLPHRDGADRARLERLLASSCFASSPAAASAANIPPSIRPSRSWSRRATAANSISRSTAVSGSARRLAPWSRSCCSIRRSSLQSGDGGLRS